jgi:hypothetical protein
MDVVRMAGRIQCDHGAEIRPSNYGDSLELEELP